jgi:type I restriction enzyme R subunit
VCKKKAKVKLADGKDRTIQHMMVTSFWHPDGTPMSAQRFMEMLFGKLPEFFKDEEELRTLWSAPDTRKKLLEGLAEKGFGKDQLVEMQKIIDAEKSDLFDVLAHVAYALAPLTREERASKAKVIISTHFNGNVNRNLTICDNPILTTPEQSLKFEMTRVNHLTPSLLERA